MADETGAALPASSVTAHELVTLLADQHDELARTLSRVPELRGAAREDVFLRARRLLAVHEALERVLLGPKGGDRGSGPRLADEVVAAEALDHDSPAFDEAFTRVVASYREHARRWERDLARQVGALAEADRERVATAVQLWQGEGDAYLGNSYAEALAAAEVQLAHR